ncbi:MAG: hypothetical protein ABEJ36_02240 [Candidatus Nanosalina sp.]
MDLDFDASNVLYLIGAFLGTLTVLYFGASYVLRLSPTTKSLLLLSGFAFFFVEGFDLGSREEILSNLGYVISGISYLVFLAYTSIKFSFSSEQVLLILGASSILFTALGYVVREKKFELEHGDARKILAVLVALAAFLFVFDVAGAHPEYSLELKENVTLRGQNPEVRLGTLTVRNDFLLSRNLEVPDYSACIYRPNRTRGHVSVENGNGMIAGGSVRKLNVTLETYVARESRGNGTETLTLPVELADSCSEGVDGSKVLIVPRSGESELYLD